MKLILNKAVVGLFLATGAVAGTATTYSEINRASSQAILNVLDNEGGTPYLALNTGGVNRNKSALSISLNPRTWTNRDVTITAFLYTDYGAHSITLPDGTVVMGNGGEYIATENGEYTFKGRDKAGNEYTETVTIDFIDRVKPTIEVTANPTEWTNQDVTLTVKGADDFSGVSHIRLPGKDVKGDTATHTVSNNWVYNFYVYDKAGNSVLEQVRVDNIDKDKPYFQILGIPSDWTKNNVHLSLRAMDSKSGVKQFELPDGTVFTDSSKTVGFDIVENSEYTFKAIDNAGNELIQTLNITQIDKIAPTISVTGNPTEWTNQDVTLTIKGDDNESGVKEIVLPNYQVVTGDTATYTVGANGTYKFLVRDHAGNETTETVKVTKIDKTAPTAIVKNNPTKWVRVAMLEINGVDNESEIKSIERPDGTVNKGWRSYYEVRENGDYEFKITDKAGNETTETVSVTKIDNTPPTFEVTGNPTEWTNQDVTLTIKGIDTQSGVKQIESLSGDGLVFEGDVAHYTVSKNGLYRFRVIDNAGNDHYQYINVDKIDKTKPVIREIHGIPSGWTKNDVYLGILIDDTPSGIKQVEFPDGKVQTYDYGAYSRWVYYSITENGEYTFKFTDWVGNETAKTFNITQIDKTAPTLNITGNPTEWTNKDATLTITGADKESGVQSITLPDGKVLMNGENLFTGFTTNGYIETNGEPRLSDDNPNLLSDYIEVDSLNFAFRRFNDNGTPINSYGEYAFFDKDKKILDRRIFSPDENVRAPEGTKYIRIWSNQIEGSTGLGMLIYTTEKPSTLKKYVPCGSTTDTNSPFKITYPVTANGNHTFKVTDRAGNVATEKVKVTKLDKTKPTFEVTSNPTEWTTQAVTLTIKGSDDESGVQSISLPDGDVLTGDKNIFPGFITRGYINAGGEHINSIGFLSDYIKVDSLNFAFRRFKDNGEPIDNYGEFAFYDKGKKFLGARVDSTQSIDENVTAPEGTEYIRVWSRPVEGSKGLGMLVYTKEKPSTITKYNPYGSIVKGDTATYTFSENGECTFIVTDKAGNETIETVKVNKIDKTKPMLHITGNPTEWQDRTTLTITGFDAPSGVKEIELPDGKVVTMSENLFPGFVTRGYISDKGEHLNSQGLLSDYIKVDSLNFAFRRFKDNGEPVDNYGEYAFYDKDKKFISAKNYWQQNLDENITAPEGTEYIRIWSRPVEGSTGLGVLVYTTEKPSTIYSTTYTVRENGEYTFKVTDIVGHVTTETVKVTKLDKTNPTIEVTTNANLNEWTNKDITFTIKGADKESGVQSITSPDGKALTISGNLFPGFVTRGYISDKGEHINSQGFLSDYIKVDSLNFAFRRFKDNGEPIDNYGEYAFYDKDKKFISAKNYWQQNLDENITAPEGTEYIRVWSRPVEGSTGLGMLVYTTEKPSTITKYVPYGTILTDDTATYTVSANGDYEFKVMDNTGHETAQTIKVTKIDKTAPTVTVTGNPTEWTKEDAILTIKATDTQSGVSHIELPNGTIVKDFVAYYRVADSGDYEFKITDKAGNVTTETVKVTKIDKTKPTVIVTGNPIHWTKQDVTLTINARDTQSGVKDITLPDGTVLPMSENLFTGFTTTGWIKENGEQEPNNPNLLSDYIEVDSLNFAFRRFKDDGTPINNYGEFAFFDKDKKIIGARYDTPQKRDENVTAPEGTKYIRIWSNPIEGETGNGLGMLVYTTEKPSTITNYVPYNPATYTVSENGDYEFKITDKVGNVTTETVKVTKIDKTKPTVTVTGNPTEWTNQDVALNIEVSDTQSGVNFIQLPDGKFLTKGENLFNGFITTGHITSDGGHWNNENFLSDYIEVDSLNFAFRRFKDNGEPVNMFGEYAFYDKDKNFLGVRFDTQETRDENVRAPEGTKYIRVWSKPLEGSTGLGMLIYTTEKPSTITQYIPYGKVLIGDTATYMVDANGEYTFKVFDKAGNETTEIVKVTKIDKTKPTLNIIGNPTDWTNQDVTLAITGTDTESGVKSITLPDGKVVYSYFNLFPGFTTTGWIGANGQHQGNNQNILSDYIEVDSLNFAFRRFNDNGEPLNQFGEYAFYDKDKNFLGVRFDTQETRDENVRAPKGTKYIRVWSKKLYDNTDNGLGMLVYTTEKPSTITKYNPFGISAMSDNETYTVYKNGDYRFKVTDQAGNETTETVKVTKIDNTPPTIDYHVNKNSGSSAILSVTYSDNESGLQSIVRPNGELKVFSSVTAKTTETETMTQNSLILVSAIDKAGNSSSKSINLLTLFTDTTSSGVSRIEYKLTGATVKDWTDYTAPFYVTNEGVTTVTARVYDEAGNVSSEKTSTVRIDKTKPTNNSILIEIK